jgi:hypothetical protein
MQPFFIFTFKNVIICKIIIMIEFIFFHGIILLYISEYINSGGTNLWGESNFRRATWMP